MGRQLTPRNAGRTLPPLRTGPFHQHRDRLLVGLGRLCRRGHHLRDRRGAVRTGETVQYVSPELASGRHTLRIRVAGDHTVQSTASFVGVGRAEVHTD